MGQVLSKIWILAWASIPIFLLGLKACQLRFASYSNIICWVSKRVYWGLHHLVSEHRLKLVFYPFFLLFPIILSCSFCVLYSLFLFCDVHLVKIVHQAQKKKKKRLQKRNRKQKKILFVVSILSNQNIIFFCLLPLI